MGKVYLTKSGGSGGGGELNFQVVGSTVEPASPEENTIWVNTNTAVNGYVFAAESPETADEGMLWITTGTASAVEFNAIKKNGLKVYPLYAKQYIGGVWVAKEAKSYQGGAWVEWFVYLLKNGVVNTKAVEGINGTISDGALYFNGTITKGTNQTYTTKAKVDLTNASTIRYVIMGTTTSDGAYFRGLVSSSEYSGGNVGSDKLAATVNLDSPFNKEVREVVLDVSALTGSYFVGYAWGVWSSAGGNRAFSGYLYDWWLE